MFAISVDTEARRRYEVLTASCEKSTAANLLMKATMRDLFISVGGNVSVKNFTAGSLTYREIPAAEIAQLIQAVRDEGGKIMAYFDFGPVLSKKKSREYRELLEAFEKVTGVSLSRDDFLSQADTETGDIFPNVNFIPTVTDKMNMLAVEYYFTHTAGAESFDSMFTVCDTTMNFHSFELAH